MLIIDPASTDVIEIFGVKYSIEMFRHLAFGPPGTRLEIIARINGVLTLQRLDEPAAAPTTEPNPC